MKLTEPRLPKHLPKRLTMQVQLSTFLFSQQTSPSKDSDFINNHNTTHGGRTFSGDYSDSSFWATISRYGAKAGRSLVYSAFALYHVLQSPNCPTKERAIILGALAYLILPIDLIPDFLPVVGLTDDAVVLATAVTKVAHHIDEDVAEKASNSTNKLLGEA
jgi:uncharacterized membrane protein YkvA (DUF1232 family)